MFPNMSPQQMQMAQEMMKNPEQMKMAQNMMQNMSDDDIKRMGNMMGMNNLDPSFMRNQAKNMPTRGMPGGMPGGIPNYNQSMNSSNISQNSGDFKKSDEKYKKIKELKDKGASQFKEGDYEAAYVTWFDGILTLEDIKKKSGNDTTLKELELSLRLNYCNAKMKVKEYEDVVNMANKILSTEKNGKAYFRLSQAKFFLGEYEEALEQAVCAKAFFKDDQGVLDLYDDIKERLASLEEEKKIAENKKNKINEKINEKVEKKPEKNLQKEEISKTNEPEKKDTDIENLTNEKESDFLKIWKTRKRNGYKKIKNN